MRAMLLIALALGLGVQQTCVTRGYLERRSRWPLFGLRDTGLAMSGRPQRGQPDLRPDHQPLIYMWERIDSARAFAE